MTPESGRRDRFPVPEAHGRDTKVRDEVVHGVRDLDQGRSKHLELSNAPPISVQ